MRSAQCREVLRRGNIENRVKPNSHGCNSPAVPSSFSNLSPNIDGRRCSFLRRQDAPPATAGGWRRWVLFWGDIKIFFSFIRSYYFYSCYYYCNHSLYNCLGFLRGSRGVTLKYIKNFEPFARHFCMVTPYISSNHNMFASSVVLYCILGSWPWLLPLSISAAGNDNNRTRNTTIGAVVGSVLIFVITVLLALSLVGGKEKACRWCASFKPFFLYNFCTVNVHTSYRWRNMYK